MRQLPRQLELAQQVAQRLHEKVCEGDVDEWIWSELDVPGHQESVFLIVKKVTDETAKLYGALYDIGAEDEHETGAIGNWTGSYLPISDIYDVSFFCDDSLNVLGAKVIDKNNDALLIDIQNEVQLTVFQAVALAIAEEVVNDYED